MTAFTVYESELKKLNGRYRWNPNGFILVEFGRSYEHHFRLDVERQDGGRRVYSGGDYKFLVSTIHLKELLYTNRKEEDDTETFWLYYYIAYEGGGVWKWSTDYVKQEDDRTGKSKRHATDKEDARNGHQQMAAFLEDLGRVTKTSQTLGID